MLLKRILAASTILCITYANSANAGLAEAIHQLAAKYQLLEKKNEVENIDSSIPIGELLILTIKLDNQPLTDVFALKSNKQALLGLTTLSQALELPVEIDLSQGSATGFIYSTDNTIRIEVQQNSLYLYANNQLIGTTDEFEIADDDLYIEAGWLANLFTFSFEFDYFAQTLNVAPRQTLPLQEKLRRQKRALFNATQNLEASLPEREKQDNLVSDPALDLQFSVSKDRFGDKMSYSAIVKQDFSYASGNFYLYGTDDDLLRSSRISFENNFHKDGSFHQLGMHKWELGDIQPVQSGRLFNAQFGRGLKFSSDDNVLSPYQEQITLSGDIQPDWDVELYLNEVLVARQSSTTDGRYEFNDITLRYGHNKLEIIKYGPFGEIERDSREILFDGQSSRPWQSTLNVSLLQPNQYLLHKNEEQQLPDYQLSTSYQLSLPFGWQSFFGVNHTFGHLETATSYAAGLQGNLAHKAVWQLNYEESGSHHQLAGSLQSNLLEQNLNFSINQNRFTDKPNENNTGVSASIAGKMPFDISYKHSMQYSNALSDNTLQWQNQLSTRIAGIQLNHQFNWQQKESTLRFGSLQASGYLDNYFTRFSASYDTTTTFNWTNYEVSISKRLNDEWQAQGQFRHNALNNTNQISMNLSWLIPQWILTSSLSYDQENDLGINLLARTSLGLVSDNGVLAISNTPLSRTGSLIVRVFHDLNSNLRFDSGEPLLPDVKVISKQSSRHAVTEQNGMALLKTLAPNKRTDIEIDYATLPDPFMIRADKGFSITPRAGIVEFAEIPIAYGGEIDGTLYDDTTGKAAAYVELELINKQGQLIATSKSEHDGYYLFNEIPPGQYLVRTSSKNNKIIGASLAEFKVSSVGEVYANVDLNVRKSSKTTGYIAQIQQFNNLKLLKMYWQLLQKRYVGSANSVFYLQTHDSKHFQLAAGFFENEQDATIQCETLISQQIPCQSVKVETNL